MAMLSVLMATHNGADTIDRTLAAMSEMDAPDGGWKLVVVNNASTDDTGSRILRWRDRLPLDYIVEPRLGKSNAINTGLEHAEGDFIVMTDDDVLPDRNWLTEWRRMADTYPEISVFGGAIVPEFEETPPAWLIDTEGCFGALYGRTPSMSEGGCEDATLIHFNFPIAGANLAIRKSISDQGWRFGGNFMIGQNGLMGEDSDFVRRLWAKGHKVGFAPTARVRHIIQKFQMTLQWIQRRCFRHGRFMFILEEASWDEASNRHVFRFPRWRIRRCAETALLLCMAALRRDTARIFNQSRVLAYDLGALSQALTLTWEKKSLKDGADHASGNRSAG